MSSAVDLFVPKQNQRKAQKGLISRLISAGYAFEGSWTLPLLAVGCRWSPVVAVRWRMLESLDSIDFLRERFQNVGPLPMLGL